MSTRHNFTFTITPEEREFLKKLGNGNASQGISKAVAMLRKQKQPKDAK